MHLLLRRTAQRLLQAYLTEQVEVERYKSEMIPRAARAYQLYLSKYRQIASAYPQVIILAEDIVSATGQLHSNAGELVEECDRSPEFYPQRRSGCADAIRELVDHHQSAQQQWRRG